MRRFVPPGATATVEFVKTTRTDLSERAGVVELAARAGNGLEVALLWNRHSGSAWVDVLHVATGESLTVDAEPARALDVYYHPFAYCLAEAA
jgi:hypothetical protein